MLIESFRFKFFLKTKTLRKKDNCKFNSEYISLITDFPGFKKCKQTTRKITFFFFTKMQAVVKASVGKIWSKLYLLCISALMAQVFIIVTFKLFLPQHGSNGWTERNVS